MEKYKSSKLAYSSFYNLLLNAEAEGWFFRLHEHRKLKLDGCSSQYHSQIPLKIKLCIGYLQLKVSFSQFTFPLICDILFIQFITYYTMNRDFQ